MGLFSFLKRGERSRSGEEAAPASRSEVDQLRTRARRRLVGAMVLVVAAVVGFPLLFETQPRPVRADLPIQIMPRDAAAAATTAPVPARAPEPASAPVRNDTAVEIKRDEVASAASAPASAAPAASSAPAVAAAPAVEPKPASSPAAPAPTRPTAEVTRAQAALEGRDPPPAKPAPPSANRFVVQVGAFAEAETARDVRGRVEKLGLRTYTQEVDTGSGRRIRVRVGPFAERDQADRTAAKIKAAGMAAAVLTL
jgi:DedD protein